MLEIYSNVSFHVVRWCKHQVFVIIWDNIMISIEGCGMSLSRIKHNQEQEMTQTKSIDKITLKEKRTEKASKIEVRLRGQAKAKVATEKETTHNLLRRWQEIWESEKPEGYSDLGLKVNLHPAELKLGRQCGRDLYGERARICSTFYRDVRRYKKPEEVLNCHCGLPNVAGHFHTCVLVRDVVAPRVEALSNVRLWEKAWMVKQKRVEILRKLEERGQDLEIDPVFKLLYRSTQTPPSADQPCRTPLTLAAVSEVSPQIRGSSLSRDS